MKIGSLFTGYGGLDMAVETVLGARTMWVADNAPGPKKILGHRFPGTPNLGDITQVDWSQVEPVDIITGGSPCQDLSTAGRRAGMTDGTRSNLWVQMREAITHVRPRYVVWENVRGAYSAHADSDLEHCPGCMGGAGDRGPVLRALGRVLGDLADLGYDTVWHGLRAADVGACHGRFRVFVLAWRRGHAANTVGVRCARHHTSRPGLREFPRGVGVAGTTEWGPYGAAVSVWEHIVGRTAPRPWEVGARGGAVASQYFAEWVMGLPAGWVTDVPGITRPEALTALGNGVVPQQAIAALRWCLAARVQHGIGGAA